MENINLKTSETQNQKLLFESTFKISDFNDFVRVQNIFYKALGKRKIVIFESIFSILFVLIAIFSFLSGNFSDMLTYLIIILLIIILIPLEGFVIRKISLKKTFNKEKSMFVKENNIKYFDDKIVVDSEKSHTECSYEQITNAVFSKDIDMLLVGRIMINSDKNKFSIGSSEEFENFIRTKLADNKIKIVK